MRGRSPQARVRQPAGSGSRRQQPRALCGDDQRLFMVCRAGTIPRAQGPPIRQRDHSSAPRRDQRLYRTDDTRREDVRTTWLALVRNRRRLVNRTADAVAHQPANHGEASLPHRRVRRLANLERAYARTNPGETCAGRASNAFRKRSVVLEVNRAAWYGPRDAPQAPRRPDAQAPPAWRRAQSPTAHQPPALREWQLRGRPGRDPATGRQRRRPSCARWSCFYDTQRSAACATQAMDRGV